MNMQVKYAKLLCNYCLALQPEDKLYIVSTILAEPLIREVYREALRLGAHVEIDLSFREKKRIFFDEANDSQLKYNPSLYSKAMNSFDAYLAIRAPYNLREDQSVDPQKRATRAQGLHPISNAYFERTASGKMKRTLCQYPTNASAQEAGMSLEEYEHFVFDACHLYDEQPELAWLAKRREQQQIVDYLNDCDIIQYISEGTDISFSVKDRVWINSDGRTNMPSGEVFTGPIENTVNGIVHFSYPSIYRGKEVEGITLNVKNGEVTSWSAEKGKDILDQVFEIKGSRFFGEVAIGTNYNISRSTKNILFDEKIGGTIHMAVGQSYKQTGGTNESSIHWDMITDMKEKGAIYADGIKIYEKGKFIIF